MFVLSYAFSKLKVIIKKTYVIVTNKINIRYYYYVSCMLIISIIFIMSSAPTTPTKCDDDNQDRLRKRHKVSFSIHNQGEQATSSSASNKDDDLFRFFQRKKRDSQ